MPGTILVSVLEFMDLPLASSTSIRASMGKIEYQISDKGNFSFPLTSLRDDLIFKIQDAEGNEISRAGVHIKLILEKGVWEDNFPIGNGHMHLKLQVILSDEERDRIRMMRQSALKKKHDELLSHSRRGEESDSTIIGNAALPFRATDENLCSYECGPTFPQRLFPDVLSAPSSQESPKRHLQHEAVSRLQSPVGFCNDKETCARNVVGDQLQQQQLNPKIADQYKETLSTIPVSLAPNIIQLQHKGKKPANQSPSEKHPQIVTGSEEMAILLGSEKVDVITNNLIKHNLEDDHLQYSERKTPPARNPSNVKKMISAFESGLAQDMRSHIKPPPTKYQAGTIEKKDPSETQHLNHDKSWNTKPPGFSEERVKSASLVRNLQQAPVYNGESREQINLLNHEPSMDPMQLELSAINILNKQTDSKARNTDQEEEKNNIVEYTRDQEEEKNYKDLMRMSTFETVTVSGKMHLEHLDISQKEERRMANASEGSYELCIQRDSPQKLDSLVHLDNKYNSFESSGAWIFPDEYRKICLTTSGKSVMDIMESQDTKCLGHQRSLDFPKIENVEKNAANVGTGTEGSKYEKIQETEETKITTYDDNGDDSSGGPFNQVIKVAIIIGFGLLVLLTRQRKKRMKEKSV